MNKELSASTEVQVKFEKGTVSRTRVQKVGHTGGSFNAGHNSPIQYEYVMAGEKIRERVWNSKVKLLTPKTASFQPLYITVETYFVPFQRIWKNYDKFIAQKGGIEETKIETMPNFGGKIIPTIRDETNELDMQLNNSLFWRDCITSRFIPRLWTTVDDDGGFIGAEMPAMSALPLRCAIAIYNDKLRDKRYDSAITEYVNNDSVTSAEWENYLPTTLQKFAKLKWRAKLPDSYLTNYRIDVQGMETNLNEQLTVDDKESLAYWTGNMENLSDYVRVQTQTTEMNEWEVVGLLRGTRPAWQDRTQLVGRKTVPLNYSAITQSTYNNAEGIAEEWKALGQQGGYSYTELNIKCVEYFEPDQDGILMSIARVWAGNVYSSAIHRQDLCIKPMECYRPDVAKVEIAGLYDVESGTSYMNTTQEDARKGETMGFIRNFSWLFNGRNMIYGDMCQDSYYKFISNTVSGVKTIVANQGNIEIVTNPNNSFTFYENNRFNYREEFTGFYFTKQYWKDYSDLMLDKNQAVKEEKFRIGYSNITEDPVNDFVINGDNQIYYVGIMITDTEMPIDNGEAIKNNYKAWGEH